MSRLGLVEDVLSFVTKGASKEAPKVAPKVAKPFYSAADKAATELQRGKGTGEEFITELSKVKGVKPAEIQHRKLSEIKRLPKMTKEQFLAELKKRPPQQIEEKVLRNPTKREIEDRAHEMAYDDAFQELRDEGMNRHEATDIAAEMADDRVDDYLDEAAQELGEGTDAPYHGNFALKGGENYREILLKMPGFKDERKLMELEAMRRRVDPEIHSHRYKELTQQIDELKAKKAAMPEQFKGDERHFGGEPGILASIRVSDRKGPQGEKVLHIEEIQSDWHQQGRKHGYKTSDVEARRKELEQLAWPYMEQNKPIPEELRKEIEALPKMNAVPDAPFKKNWHELAMKRMLNYAADNGYDKIAITPGATQAGRYDLSQQVDRIAYNPDTGYMQAIKDGKPVSNVPSNVPKEQLSKYVGEELADKLINSPDLGSGMRQIQGEDLKIGGEGMKGFYDKMLPDYLNSFGKKHGVQVEPLEIETKPKKSIPQIAAPGIDYFPEPVIEPAETASVHGFSITPEMREELKGGTPLYQKIAAPVGAGAAAEETLDEEPKYAAGGAVGEEYDPDQSDGGLVVRDGAAFKRGGKVKISDNPDAMFLELQDKKLKRK